MEEQEHDIIIKLSSQEGTDYADQIAEFLAFRYINLIRVQNPQYMDFDTVGISVVYHGMSFGGTYTFIAVLTVGDAIIPCKAMLSSKTGIVLIESNLSGFEQSKYYPIGNINDLDSMYRPNYKMEYNYIKPFNDKPLL
jgi:hypothetical protein